MNNAAEILKNVDECISELEKTCTVVYGWRTFYKRFKIRDVCDKLSIFDWWDVYLSYSQLLSMHEFLETAIEYGYTGYVCFKVGAKNCAHGMWAHKAESNTGSAPGGEFLFHSFRHEDNYWVIDFGDGTQSRNLNKRDLKKIMANVDAYRMAEKKRLHETMTEVAGLLKQTIDIINESKRAEQKIIDYLKSKDVDITKYIDTACEEYHKAGTVVIRSIDLWGYNGNMDLWRRLLLVLGIPGCPVEKQEIQSVGNHVKYAFDRLVWVGN